MRASDDRNCSAPPLAPIDPMMFALQAEISELKHALAEAEASQKKAIEAARDQGRKEVKDTYARDDAEALAALEAGLAKAMAGVGERIDNLDSLALLLCETALQKVFADAADYQGLVARAIRLQVAELRRETVLLVAVSAADFPDTDALLALETRVGIGGVDIAQDLLLPPGACRIDLRLGHIELSVAEHWDALQEHLRALVTSGEAL